jgi:class 3 adenylate cyclase/predicted alpha/beta hydrolase
VERSDTRYARCGELHIAYQVIGDGPIDVLFVPNVLSNVEAIWDVTSLARFLDRLAGFARVIIYDQRGSGMSDPLPMSQVPTYEELTDDAKAVLDAVGSERAAVVAYESGGPVAFMLAASHPQRVSAVVAGNSLARARWAPDYPTGLQDEVIDMLLDFVEQTWGGQGNLPGAENDVVHQQWARYQRQAASPGAARLMRQAVVNIDVREVLPSVRVPTLVVVHAGIPGLDGPEQRIARCNDLAERIPGARLLQLDGPVDPPDDLTWLADEAHEFLTGVRDAPERDRVLATVLFSDIVGSTQRAATVGDRAWNDLLDAHDDMVRRQLDRFGGNAIKSLGDGFLATFDGPTRAVRCAQAIRDGAHRIDLEVRIGLHTGEIELRGDDVSGMAVNLAARVAAIAEPSQVLVSRTVTDLAVGSGLPFMEYGTHELKGVPGTWQLFALAG